MLSVGGRKLSDPYFKGPFSPLPQQVITQLGGGSSFEAAMIRLLMGAADLHSESGDLILKQRTNYMVLGCERSKVRTESGIRQALKRLGISAEELDALLRRGLTHQGYYKSVVSELIEYFIRDSKRQSTVAFLHAYRLLERVSFVFPLMYAARSAKYPEAFAALKAYFKGGLESELALLRKFQDSSIDASYADVPVDLDFSTLEASVVRTAMSAAKRCVANDDIVSDVSPILTIRSGGLLALLINVRNRYFHSSVSNEANISVVEIGDSDAFFSVLNRPVMNWLSILILNTVVERLK